MGRIDLWVWPMRAAEDARGSKILFITCSLVGHCRKGKPPKNGDGAELARFQPFHHHFPLVFYAPHVPTAFIKQTHTPTSHPYIYIYICIYYIWTSLQTTRPLGAALVMGIFDWHRVPAQHKSKLDALTTQAQSRQEPEAGAGTQARSGAAAGAGASVGYLPPPPLTSATWGGCDAILTG